MDSKSSGKKNHVITVILSILAVVLLIAVYLQGGKLTKFLEGLDKNSPAENSQAEIKTDSDLSEKSLSQDDEEALQKKIQNLEIRITEMQGEQDQLEDTLNEYGEKDAVSEAREEFDERRNFDLQYKDFFAQNNYPPESSEKMYDLNNEMMSTLLEHMRNIPKDWENPKDWSKNKEFNRQTEEIMARYDEKTAELLPEGGPALLEEYENRIKERSLVYYFQGTLGDEALEKEKEWELIDILYKGAQPYNIQDEDQKNIPNALPNVIPEKKLDEETIARLAKMHEENMRKTYESYPESAEAILSDSQMVKFEGFINMLKSMYLEDETTENSDEEEKGEE